MTLRSPREFDVGEALRVLAERTERAGGRMLIVGGWVRDALLGRSSKDIDVEVHGLDADQARALLGDPESGVRRVHGAGRAFPVWVVHLTDATHLDISLAEDPVAMSDFTTAARHARAALRRDLRINAMGFDPLTGELFDPCGGRDDLEVARLRCVDPERFREDPLRILRVARFAAQLGFEPDGELVGVCAAGSLRDVAVERVFAEWERLLLAADPARGLEVLARTGVRANFEVLEALDGVPQDARWHPEGCVWTHTVMGVREAAALRSCPEPSAREERDLRLMWAALCHDLGKPGTTVVDADADAVRSPAHDSVGENLTRAWLTQLLAPARTIDAVASLVRWHLAPALLIGQKSGDRAFRRLARRLGDAGVDAELLWRVARADYLGRTTPEALAKEFGAGDAFLARMQGLEIDRATPVELVRGRDVLAAGVVAGPEVGRVLERCRDIQDETGWTDGGQILARALEGSR